MRNLKPGGKPKYFITSGHHSSRCSTCSGRKNSALSENSSPAQIYHPVVSPSGLFLRPFIGKNPFLLYTHIYPNFKIIR